MILLFSKRYFTMEALRGEGGGREGGGKKGKCIIHNYTVEALNNGHVGDEHFVHR